jgi:hypothetical protein
MDSPLRHLYIRNAVDSGCIFLKKSRGQVKQMKPISRVSLRFMG